ncbi:cell wall-binding repeat-containing protein [Peribacillus alkalitolerans]|uniref:cell wall-binding repeat-containing protein n=1 Tax=Peribacillus alkalitolerans TaxID=1550385 RepID=UPI0013D50F34|nr:cell wall-binding repeat-containing protein [Peribacillus alkalitolerans]
MKKILILVLLLPLVLLGKAGSTSAAGGTIERLDGANRFEVAVNISREGWPTTTNTVVVANYNAFADALSAAPLAYYKNAPILLTQSNVLTAETKQEIFRLKPREVIVIGGEGSISNEVLAEISGMGVSEIKRIGGNSRFEVSAAIAAELPIATKVVVADGTKFPDALSIAPYAAKNGYPILLTYPNTLPAEIKNAIDAIKPQSSIVVGGTASVSSTVSGQLPSPLRIGGSNRFEVSANVIKQLNLQADSSFMATGLSFADALTGSVLAAKQNKPILLTGKSLPDPIKQIIYDKKITNFTVLGGTASVTTYAVNQAIGDLIGLKIVVDAGHGDSDPGAVANGLEEEDIVLDVAKRLHPKLLARGAIVYMTRTSDTYPSLDDRINLANTKRANVFVSIHVNSATPEASGIETYWNSTYASADSQELAGYIQKELVQHLGGKDRGVKTANFKVIKYTQMASVLAELGFITNPTEAARMKTTTFREQAAIAIYDGVSTYWRLNKVN